jgi:dienelactone hydrolase
LPAVGVCAIKLQGLLYKPTGGGNTKHPAVILVSGSAGCSLPLPGGGCTHPVEHFCELKKVLLAAGFVVFEPAPRGYEFSTGVYVADNVTDQVNRFATCALVAPGSPSIGCLTLDLEQEGTQDIGQAFRWLREQPYVNPAKIAVIGHSYGGIRSLGFDTLSYTDSTHPQKPAAVVTIGAASEGWCAFQPMLSEFLHDADVAKAPLFLIDTFNDVSRAPVFTLAAETGATGHQFQAAIFPPARDASGNLFTCGNQAHVCFVGDKTYVDVWSAAVLDFLARYGVK